MKITTYKSETGNSIVYSDVHTIVPDITGERLYLQHTDGRESEIRMVELEKIES